MFILGFLSKDGKPFTFTFVSGGWVYQSYTRKFCGFGCLEGTKNIYVHYSVSTASRNVCLKTVDVDVLHLSFFLSLDTCEMNSQAHTTYSPNTVSSASAPLYLMTFCNHLHGFTYIIN